MSKSQFYSSIFHRAKQMLSVGCVTGLLLSSCTQQTQEAAVHLPGYEEFAHYNEIGRFTGFTISELEQDGKLYYAFSSDEVGAFALVEHVDKAQGDVAQLLLYNETDSAAYLIDRFVYNGPNFLQLADVTGDEVPEFIYSTYWGGTGALEATCKVFDLKSLKEIPVFEFEATLLESITVIPLSIEEKSGGNTVCVCEVSLTGENQAYRCSVQVKDGAKLEDCIFEPGDGSRYVSIGLSEQDSCLEVEVGFSLSPSVPGQFLGSVHATLAFQSETCSFELVDLYTIEPNYFPT